MKIVHITEAWKGGIATYVQSLIAYQIKSDDFRQIILIYSSNVTKVNLEEEYKNHKKVKLYHYKSSRNPLKFLAISCVINKILLKINPDLVHLHSTFPGVYGRLKQKYPTIFCAHAWSFVQDISIFEKYIYAFVEKILAKKTDAIVNISRSEANAAKKFSVKAMRNPIILTGVSDVNMLPKQPKLKLDSNCLNIGFIGRLDYQKGFDIIEPFFKEYNHLSSQFSGKLGTSRVKLYVIGNSEIGKEKTYQSCENISYLGWINIQEIDNYISLFDVIIMPSRWEGFGLVALDALKNNKPIIVSNRGALSEFVIDGFNGFVFDIDNVQEELSHIFANINKKTLAKIGKNSRQIYCESFTLDKFTNKITALYKEVLKI